MTQVILYECDRCKTQEKSRMAWVQFGPRPAVTTKTIDICKTCLKELESWMSYTGDVVDTPAKVIQRPVTRFEISDEIMAEIIKHACILLGHQPEDYDLPPEHKNHFEGLDWTDHRKEIVMATITALQDHGIIKVNWQLFNKHFKGELEATD